MVHNEGLVFRMKIRRCLKKIIRVRWPETTEFAPPHMTSRRTKEFRPTKNNMVQNHRARKIFIRLVE